MQKTNTVRVCSIVTVTLLSTLAGFASVSVPFELRRDYLMVISIWVHDQGPFSLGLDTGSDTTIISSQLAEQLGLAPVDRVFLVTPSGTHTVARGRISRLTLDPHSIVVSDLEALWMDLPDVRAVDSRVAGLLGQNFLTKFNYIIDFRRRRIEFEQAGELKKQLRGTRLPLDNHAAGPVVETRLACDGKETLRLLLDSGTPAAVIFQTAQTAGLKRLGKTPFKLSSNGASRNAWGGRLGCLQLGKQILYRIPLILLDEGKSEHRYEDGLLPVRLFEAIYFNNEQDFVILNPKAFHGSTNAFR